MTSIIIANWNELNEELYAGSWQERLGRFRSSYAFRGMASTGYDLTTSLARLGGSSGQVGGMVYE